MFVPIRLLVPGGTAKESRTIDICDSTPTSCDPDYDYIGAVGVFGPDVWKLTMRQKWCPICFSDDLHKMYRLASDDCGMDAATLSWN